MITKIIVALSVVTLASCTVSEPQEIPSGSGTNTGIIAGNSGNTGDTGTTVPSPVITGSTSSTGAPSITRVNIAENEQKSVDMKFSDTKGILRVEYGTGARLSIRVAAIATGETLTVNLATPEDAMGNIRISQIIDPDGTADGPFGRDLTHVLAHTGTYTVILGPNMMAGDPWSGVVEVSMMRQ